jgi:hypothetical protein
VNYVGGETPEKSEIGLGGEEMRQPAQKIDYPKQ